jgi:hypothetical protein
MQENDQPSAGRRTLLTNLSVAAVAGLAAGAGSAPARAQERTLAFVPAQHARDNWMNELPGSHRVFIDSATLPGGANAMRYANNILSAHIEEYAGAASDYAMIVCFRHTSTAYGFNDAIWAKYGSRFDRRADPAPSANPMNTASGANGENSLESLAAQGVKYVICNRATRTLSRGLAAATGASPEDVYAELVAGAIPNSRFVAAGVLAVTRAQELGYSLVYSE